MLCYCAEYAFKDAVGVCGVWGRYAFSRYGVECRSGVRRKVICRHVQCAFLCGCGARAARECQPCNWLQPVRRLLLLKWGKMTDVTLSGGDAPAGWRVCAVAHSGAGRSLAACRICLVFVSLASARLKLDLALLPSAEVLPGSTSMWARSEWVFRVRPPALFLGALLRCCGCT